MPNKEKQTKQCFVYTFALDPSFWDERKLEKIFKVEYNAYCLAYKFYNKRIRAYRDDPENKAIIENHAKIVAEQKEIKKAEALAKGKKFDESNFKVPYSKEEKDASNALLAKYNLNGKRGDNDLLRQLRHNFRETLDSEMVSFAVQCVVNGVQKVLFTPDNRTAEQKAKGPRQLSLRRQYEFETIGGATNNTGVKVRKIEGDFYLEYAQFGKKGKVAFSIPIKTKTGKPEIDAMLEMPVKYSTIKRKRTKKGWKYQVQIVFDGVPTRCNLFPVDNVVGVDITEGHIAVVTDDYVGYQKLYSVPDKQEEKKAEIERKMDELKRRDNPDNFNEDGTAKKGKHKWHFSKQYVRLRNEKKVLEEHNTNKVIYMQNCLANTVANMGKDVRVIKKDFELKKRRASETTIDEKGRYEDKSSLSAKPIANNAPARLVEKIGQRLNYIGGTLTKISNQEEPIYSIDIFTGEKLPYGIDDEYYMIDNKKIHRTVYYAFMMTGYDKTTGKFDYELLKNKFANFYKMYQNNIDANGNIVKTLIAK